MNKSRTEPQLFYMEQLNAFKRKIDPKLISIGFQTDNHYDLWYWVQHVADGISKVNNLTYLKDSVDVLIAGGDNVQSGRIGRDLNVKLLAAWATKFFEGNSKADRFLLRGNHDDGSQKPSDFNTKRPKMTDVILENEFKRQFKTGLTLSNEIRDEDSLYGYKDYPKHKVRVVLVDSVDNPTIIDSLGKLKYYGMGTMGFRERQLKWLAEEAFGTCPQDYHLILFSHVPINHTQNDSNSINHDCLIKIIQAFKNKEATNIETKTTQKYEEDFAVDFSVDFTARETSHFVGYIAGHTHTESISTKDGFNVITCRQSVFEDWQPEKFLGTEQEDALQVLQIDTANRKLIIHGFGRSTDREYSY